MISRAVKGDEVCRQAIPDIINNPKRQDVHEQCEQQSKSRRKDSGAPVNHDHRHYPFMLIAGCEFLGQTIMSKTITKMMRARNANSRRRLSLVFDVGAEQATVARTSGT